MMSSITDPTSSSPKTRADAGIDGASGSPDAIPAESVGEAYLAILKSRGIDYLYMGAGTDTAPLVEAYARQPESGLSFPTPVVCVHENLAVGMAHGYYMVSGRPQAVMLHVSVGAANAVCGLLNATRSQCPIFFTAGRTPLFERGARGSRNSEIHWAQEMYDQAGMVRELVKWDYELRDGLNLQQVVDRGLGIAMAEPRGPVYLTLPRETLTKPLTGLDISPSPAIPATPSPDRRSLAQLAERLAAAEFPLIVCSASGADPATLPLLVELCERFGIAVVESKPRHVNFPSDHALHIGFNMASALPLADVVLVLESDVPWVPATTGPRNGAFIAQAGTDPLFNRYPLRSFHADLSLTTGARPLLEALFDALDELGAEATSAPRRDRIVRQAEAVRAASRGRIARDLEQAGPISKTYLSHCLDQVRAQDAILINEYSAQREFLNFRQPGTYFLNSSAAGLGWGFPAALGAKQADPERTVIAVLGDGAYLFANPAACHHAAAMHQLPVLVVVFNNQAWEAVYRSTLRLYPDSHTAEHVKAQGSGPLSSLKPVPAFEKYAEASDGYAERVMRREDLIPALKRGLAVVRNEKRLALLNVVTE